MEKKTKIYLITSYAIFTALFCIFAPMSVPIGPIPISLTNLVLYLAIYIIGMKGSLTSFIIYLLLGIVGLPVFSGFQGGPAKVVGPTGGYLVGFILVAIIGGLFYDKSKDKMKIPMAIIGMVIGTLVLYLFGTIWFVILMKCEFSYALSVCVIPFIPFDIGKIVIATLIGVPVRKALTKAGF